MSDKEIIQELTAVLNELILAITGPANELIKVVQKANALLDRITKGEK
jgi:hypothetical protein